MKYARRHKNHKSKLSEVVGDIWSDFVFISLNSQQIAYFLFNTFLNF